MRNHIIHKLLSWIMVLGLVLSAAPAAADTMTAPVSHNASLQLITGSDLVIEASGTNAPYMYPGESMLLSVSPADKYTAQSWISTNEAVAAVDSDGLVTAIAPGTALMRVTTSEGNINQEYQVIVLDSSTVYTIAYHVNYPADAYTFVFNKEVKYSRPTKPQDTTFTEDYQGIIPGSNVTLNNGDYVQTVNYKVTQWIDANDPSKKYDVGSEIPLSGNMNLEAGFESTVDVEETFIFQNKYAKHYTGNNGEDRISWKTVESGGIVFTNENGEKVAQFMLAANQRINFYYVDNFRTMDYDIKLEYFRLSSDMSKNTSAVADYLGEVWRPGQLIELPYQKVYYFEPVMSQDNNRNTVVVIRKQTALSSAQEGVYNDAYYYYVGQGTLSEHGVEVLDSLYPADPDNWGKEKAKDGSYDELHMFSDGGTMGSLAAYTIPLDESLYESYPDIKQILAALGETVSAEDSLEVVFYKIGRTGKGYTLDGVLRKKGVKHNITVVDTVTGRMVAQYTFNDQDVANVYQLAKGNTSNYREYKFLNVSFTPDGSQPLENKVVAIDQDCTVYLCYEGKTQVYHIVRFLDEEGRDVYNLDAEDRKPFYQRVPDHGSADVPANVEKEGYRFDGWYTAKQSEGGTQVTGVSIDDVTQDMDFYAHFTKLTGSITIEKIIPAENGRNFTVRVYGFTGSQNFRNVTVPANGSATLNDVPVGEYRIEEVLLGADSVNYKADYDTASFTVEENENVKKQVSNKPVIHIYVEGNTGEYTYNASAQTVRGYSVKCDSALFRESDVVLSGGAAEVSETDVCSEKPMGLTESRFSYSNQNIVAVFHVTDGWITIHPAEIQIGITGNRRSYTYDGTPKTAEGYTAACTDILYDETKVALVSGDAVVTETNPGGYPMDLTADQFAYNDPNVKASFTVVDGHLDIIEADLVINITGDRKTFTYDGTEKAAEGYTAACESNLFDEKKIVFSGNARIADTDAGTYPMGLEESQFSYNDSSIKAVFVVTDGLLQIIPAPVTVEISGNQAMLPYNGLTQLAEGYTRTISNPLYTDSDYSFAGTAAAEGVSTGVYPMNLSADQCTNLNSNFDAAFIVHDGSLEITPVRVTVTADNKVKQYGQPDPELTAQVAGLVNNESVHLIHYDLIRDEGEAVGSYPIMPVGEERQGNYLVRYNPGVLVIGADIVITITGNRAAFVYDGTEKSAVGYTSSCESELFDASRIVFTGSARADGTNAGDYPMGLSETQFTYNDSEINAVFVVTDGLLQISPAPVTVEITGHQAVLPYSGQAQQAEGYDRTISNTLYTDHDYTFTGTAIAEGTNTGSYPMGLSADQCTNMNSNFEALFIVTDGLLQITPIPVTVEITGHQETLPYNGQVQLAEGYDRTISNPLYTDSDYSFAGTAIAEGTNTGSYPMGLSADQCANLNSNFEAVFIVKDGLLQITPVPVTVEITGHQETLPYNGQAQYAEGYDRVISNPLYTDNDYSFTGTAFAEGTNTGSYPMGLSADQCANLNGNFTATFIVRDGQLEITPVPVTVTADDKQKDMGQADPVLTAQVTGLVNNESPDLIVYTLARAAGEDVGTYPITPTGEERQGNYVVQYVPGTLTIRNLITLTVQKVWDDDNNASGERPASLDLYLFANGEVVRTVTLSETNLWQAAVQVPDRDNTGAVIAYRWIEPDIPGYEQADYTATDTAAVLTNRIITADVPDEEFTLIIHYQDLDGNPMAEDYSGVHRTGDAYRVDSPVINGFQTNTLIVEGNMPAQDLVVTVLYVAANPGQRMVLVAIDDYRTPLGLGTLSLNIGDAFE